MKIALIYNKSNEATTGTYIEKVFKQYKIDYKHFWTERSFEIPRNFDLYFRIDHGDYKYDIPGFFRPAVFYAIDTHLKKPYKKIKKQAKHYDIIFYAQKQGADRLRQELKIDAHWIPLGCDPDITRKTCRPKIYDIGFVGRNAEKADRGKQLRGLKHKYPKSFIGSADFRDMGRIYSESKVGFNSSVSNDINMRIFEIMSSGCFLLTNYIKSNGFEDLFEDRKHLVVYKNDRELFLFADYYLENQEERERIARLGYEMVLKKHTYYIRVQSMFNYIAFKFGGQFNKLRI